MSNVYEQSIRAEIRRYVAESPANRFSGSDAIFFDEPLIGFAAGDDPLWGHYKQVIGDHHLTPAELVASSPGDGKWEPGSVISWVLPIAKKTREINRQERFWPSPAWALTANRGNDFLAQLRAHVADFLRRLGQRAVVPQPITIRERIGELEVPVSTTWSERHSAHAAGLGTFGLNGGLITERGIAHRCGSIVTELVLPPTPRPYPDHRHYCLFHRFGSCGLCIGRCPSEAVSSSGTEKLKCFVRIYRQAPAVLAQRYGMLPEDCKVGSCGLCQTDLPCEERIPLS